MERVVPRRRGARPLTSMTVRERLMHACVGLGGQRAWARVHAVAPSYVSAVIAGEAEPGPKILEALELRREEPTYRPVEETSDE